MASGYRNAAGVDFDDLYDPDVVGDGQNVGNYRKSNGVGVQYANIKYGVKGPDVGYRTPGGVDLSTFWAKKGSTGYSLPINGASYGAAVTTSGASKQASLQFQVATSGYLVSKNEAGTVTNLASGALPAGAVSMQFTDAWLNAASDTGAGTVTNGAAGYMSIAGTYTSITVAMAASSGLGTKQTTYSIGINFKNSAGVVISSTTVKFVCSAAGL